MTSSTMMSRTPQQPVLATDRELVVLVHGLAASRSMLRPLEMQLQRSGYETLNWGYPSIRGDIESVAQALQLNLRQVCEDVNVDRVHLVTHSMGSIIARIALANVEFTRLGRVVMLAPPHGGSHVATRLAKWLGWLFKPLPQLADPRDSFVNTLVEPIGHEIGIIAAARDRVVRIESTRLAQQSDHIVVDTGHSSMLIRKEVWRLIESFLRSGRFERQVVQFAPS